jgi:hypothetical protein
MRSKVCWAVHEDAVGRSCSTRPGSARPVLQGRSDEIDTNEGDGWTRDDWGKETLQDLWWHERETDFEEGAEASSANERPIAVGTRKRISRCI